MTAFQYASINGRLPVVQYLVEQGVAIDIQDTVGIIIITFAYYDIILLFDSY